MKDQRNLHQKVQEFIDCYAANDPLKEMSEIARDPNAEESALKWIGLAALHGINAGAEKISLSRNADGSVSVTAKYREAKLPSPGPAVGGKIFDDLREITHISEEKGKIQLALGVRDGSVDLTVKLKSKAGKEKVTLKFPE